MKKVSVYISTFILAAASASQAFAAVATGIGDACPGNGFSGLCLHAGDLGKVVGSLITFIFVIVGLIALGWLVFGGFKWLTSQGDKTEVEGARNHIVAALIGLFIIFMSYLVVNVLLGFITGNQVSLSNLSIPSLGHP